MKILTFVAIGLLTTQNVLSEDNPADQLRQWVRDLGHDRFSTRQTATQKLIEAGAPAIPLVREAANHKDLEVVWRATGVLVHLFRYGDAESRRLARAALADLTLSKNRMVSRRASVAMQNNQFPRPRGFDLKPQRNQPPQRLAKDAVPALIEALKDKDFSVRYSAILALGRIGPGAKDAVLALTAMSESNSDTHSYAAEALKRIQGK